MNFILFGFKSCGKTTLGKKVAEKLKRTFIDSDNTIEEMYAKESGETLSYRAIFQKVGEKRFRELESEALQSLKNVQNCIIAVGGGAILNPSNVIFLTHLGRLIYLKLDKGSLKARLFAEQPPAYFDPYDPEGSFEKVYEERQVLYEKIPSLQIELSGKDDDWIVSRLCTMIKNEEHGQ